MSASTTARDRATRCAASDPAGSLALAHQVEDPWSRCQAMAWAARYAPDERVPGIVREALAAAACDPDPFRAVGASAWAVRALVERGLTGGIGSILGGLLRTAATIPHPVCRMDALFLLWQAVFPLRVTWRRHVQDALVDAYNSASSWRAGRTLADVALTVAADDPDEAARVVSLMRDGRHRRQATRRLAAGERRTNRAFFWR